MNPRLALIALSLIITGGVIACAEAENSAGKVLNNANSVVRTGQEKLFMTPSPGDVPESSHDRRDDRY